MHSLNNYENSGESLLVIHSTHCISKAILCQRSNDADHISEKALHSLDRRVKTNLGLSVNSTDLHK
jgi:hypothetical protein